MCRTDLTARKKALFLAKLAETGNVSRSCEAADISRQTVYTNKKAMADFAAEWTVAEDKYIERLEAEADRRAVEGVRKKKFTKTGAPIMDPETGLQYEEREYSDTLLIFRLKGLRPDTYRDNSKVEHTGDIKMMVVDV